MELKDKPKTPYNSLLGGKPTPKRLVCIGDSMTRQAESLFANGVDYDISSQARGVINWLQILLDHPFEYYNAVDETTEETGYGKGLNAGRSNDKIKNVRERLIWDVLRKRPDVVYLSIGTNDGNGDTPLEEWKEDYEYVVDTLINEGILVISERHHNRTDFTENQKYLQAGYNNVISNHARRNSAVIVTDSALAMSSPDSNTGLPDPDNLRDAIHRSAKGAFAVAKQAAEVLQGMFPPRVFVPTLATDIYDATYNPYGCMNDNPLFFGTGGTVGDNITAAGGIPDDWRVYTEDSNLTAVVTIVDAPTDKPWMRGKWMKVDVTSTGAGTGDELLRIFKSSSGGITTNSGGGKHVYGAVGVKFDAPNSDAFLREPNLKIQGSDGSAVQGIMNSIPGFCTSETWCGQIVSLPLELKEGNTSTTFQFNIKFDTRIASTQTFYMGQMGLREMEEPDY